MTLEKSALKEVGFFIPHSTLTKKKRFLSHNRVNVYFLWTKKSNHAQYCVLENGFYKQVLEFHRPFEFLCQTDCQCQSRNSPHGFDPSRGIQRDVVYLCWPIAPSCMSPNAGGRGRVARSEPMSTAVHRSPNKLWRSNYILTYGSQQPPTQGCQMKLCCISTLKIFKKF